MWIRVAYWYYKDCKPTGLQLSSCNQDATLVQFFHGEVAIRYAGSKHCRMLNQASAAQYIAYDNKRQFDAIHKELMGFF